MKPKTPGQVIAALKACAIPADKHERDCLQRAIAIVRLWDAGITPADVRAAERKRKGRAK